MANRVMENPTTTENLMKKIRYSLGTLGSFKSAPGLPVLGILFSRIPLENDASPSFRSFAYAGFHAFIAHGTKYA
jgi:hypothetical protein